MKFEQAHFECERFLHVGVQQPLGLLQGLQIFQCLPRGDAPGDGLGAGNFREFQQTAAGGEGAEPHVAQPPLHEQKRLRPLTAIFRLDGRSEFVFPLFAQIFFDFIMLLQRRTRGQGFIHALPDFAEFLQQHVEQPVAAQQTFLIIGRQRVKTRKPFPLRRIQRADAFAKKIQAQTA